MQNYPNNITGNKYRYVGNQLQKNPSLRCSRMEMCIEQVRSGDRVYPHVINIIIYISCASSTNDFLKVDCFIFGEHYEQRASNKWQVRQI